MDIMMRYHDGEGPASVEGVVNYVGTHLQHSQEAGSLRSLPGYLTKNGRVEPLLYSDIWKLVGWSGEGLPPELLIKNLCEGKDLSGKRLTRGKSIFRAPKELVVSLPCELSEAVKNDPEAGYEILVEVIRETMASIEEVAVRKRYGMGRKAKQKPASGRPLALGYPHGENRAGEPDLHGHIYVFPPAIDSEGAWMTYDNTEHVARLSKPGGARERATDALIAIAARYGYIVELIRGKAEGSGPQGARVTCPDGRVIERGSVKRSRRLEVLAAQEMARECGAAPLTRREIEKVRKMTGRFPAKLKGIKRSDKLRNKLTALGFLDPEGRIHPPVGFTAACQTMEENMAIAQVTLSDLPLLPGASTAAEGIKEKRKALRAQVPGVEPNTNQARIRWTSTYDRVLELVASYPEGLTTDDLDQPTRDNLSKLKRAGILRGVKTHGRMHYTLGPEGEERLARGRQEQAEVETLVARIAHQAMVGSGSPGQVRGRLEMLGIQTNPPLGRFEIGAVGRVVEDPELVASTGIQATTDTLPDHPWWERWWMRFHKLPEVLKRAIMQPLEVMERWSQEVGRMAAETVDAESKSRAVAKAKAGKMTAAPDRSGKDQAQHKVSEPQTKPLRRAQPPASPDGGVGNGRQIK